VINIECASGQQYQCMQQGPFPF